MFKSLMIKSASQTYLYNKKVVIRIVKDILKIKKYTHKDTVCRKALNHWLWKR